MHPLQVLNFQVHAYREKAFFLASQNTLSPTIFVWDLYNKRSNRNAEERSADEADLSLEFPDDFSVFNFRWHKNTSYLYTTSAPRGQTNESYLSLLNVKIVEQSLEQFGSFGANGHNDSDDESGGITESISFKTPSKDHSFIKLPFQVNNFCINDRNKNYIFGSHSRAKFVLDFNSPKDLKYFDREEVESNGVNYSEFEATFNSRNYVIFSGNNIIQIYDIRKENEKLIEINLNSDVSKVDVDPFNEDEFVAVLDDYLVRININCFYECLFFGQWDKK